MSKKRKIDNTIGEWSWNWENFTTKYRVEEYSECWIWEGAQHPAGGLFGAYKNGVPQMTQARRISWMQFNNSQPDRFFIKSTCRNIQCVNPAHHYNYRPLTY